MVTPVQVSRWSPATGDHPLTAKSRDQEHLYSGSAIRRPAPGARGRKKASGDEDRCRKRLAYRKRGWGRIYYDMEVRFLLRNPETR